ncbi:MAG: cytochrome C oxidase subunit I [Nitrospirae bacterium RBG_16_64_22]|nr:MAG: cytochrome C oxidase subunit I [Nitrospirae bacterium RBG_16_64_22]
MQEAVAVQTPWFRASFKEWILTTDHKKIAVLYAVTSLVFFAVAGLMGLVIRLELTSPGMQYVSHDFYNYLLTGHGAVLLLWWAIAFWGAFTNFLIPLMIGARDVAFPRLNQLSYWFFFSASILVLITLIPSQHIKMMWTGYPPFSLNDGAGPTVLYVLIIWLVAGSTLGTGVNFITTVLKMRTPGVTLGRMNLMIHGLIGSIVIQLLGVPAFVGAVTMLFLDKYIGTGFFNPAVGGDPVLYQHLFWFYSHPAVYVMILPAFGVFSEVISAMSRKPIFGQKSMMIALWAIAILGFEVWAHHMFTSGMPDWLRIVMSYTTVLIAVPTGIKIFNWVATLHKGAIRFHTPMLFTLGGIFMFLIGGLTGIPLALPSFDIHVHDSAFVVGHFHYVLAMAVTFGAFSGAYFWYPKVTGRMFPEGLGKASFWLMLVGSNIFYFTQMMVGIAGMPRRYADYPAIPEWITLNEIQTVGAFILAAGVVLSFLAWIRGLKGPKADRNPWGSPSLEWTTASPPAPHNFDKFPVEVPEGWSPYHYGKRS